MSKFLSVVVFTLLLLSSLRLIWGENGLQEFWQVKQQVKQLAKQNSQLAQRNSRLAAEVADLKSGLDAVEERARHDLGMLKENETFFWLIKPENYPKTAPNEN